MNPESKRRGHCAKHVTRIFERTKIRETNCAFKAGKLGVAD